MLVGRIGIEPMTSRLKICYSASWVNGPVLPFMHKKSPFQYADIPKGAFDAYWEKRSCHRFYSFRYIFGPRWITLIKGGYTTTRSIPVLMVPLFVQMLMWLKIKHFFKPCSFLILEKIILKQKRPLSAWVTERGLEFHAEKKMITSLAPPLPIPLWIDCFRDRVNCMEH